MFKTLVDRVLYHIGPGEVGLAAETSSFLSIIIYGLRLFEGESQAHQVIDAHRVWVEWETFITPWCVLPTDGNGFRTVLVILTDLVALIIAVFSRRSYLWS